MTDKKDLKHRIGLLDEAFAEHDAECCTAAAPCAMRAGMRVAYGQYQAQLAKPEVLPADQPATEPGMYLVDGVVYKVVASKTPGRVYASVLNVLVDPVIMADGKKRTHNFKYAAGAIYKIKAGHRMTLEDAENWSYGNGSCCRCGIELTASIGIGPVCRKKI